MDKFVPKPLFHITNLNYEVSDIVFLERSSTLIISCATNLEKGAMESMKFWKKKEKGGEILVYKLNISNNSSAGNNKDKINYVNVGPSFSLINSIKTDVDISCLYLSPENKYLIVGYFDGFI